MSTTMDQVVKRAKDSFGQMFDKSLHDLVRGIQDKIRDKQKVQAYHMMFSMNIWSCLWASIGILITGEMYG
ncbi:unnamed protein product, partial [Rotaria sp. Silwood1]